MIRVSVVYCFILLSGLLGVSYVNEDNYKRVLKCVFYEKVCSF